MADKKISALSGVTTLLGGEIIPVVQSGTTLTATVQQIAYVTPQSVSTLSGTSFSVSASTFGNLLVCTNASLITVTVDTSAGGTVGQRIDFLQSGAGQITFVGTATINTSAAVKKTRAQYSVVTLLCVATSSYVLLGDLASS